MDNKLYEMMDWAAVEGIVYSEEDHPHDILGAHVTEEGILIQTFLPTAKSVTVVLKDSKKEYPMDLEDEEGFFAALLPGKKIPKYHYHVDFGEEADGKENIHIVLHRRSRKKKRRNLMQASATISTKNWDHIQ